MRKLEHYISAGGKRLRCGYTTGTCAAAATRAAAELLLGGVTVPSVVVSTPAGIEVVVDVEESDRGDTWATCAVRKDAGDDPDITDGILVYAKVEVSAAADIVIEGGVGVGRVTKPGLDQGVGAAAINSVPRAMIEAAARGAAEAHRYTGGLTVTISVPDGVELAQRTFNPRLGVEGGISVLGTSGIVRPMSEEALMSSIRLELKVLRASGVRD
ncbi:MAG: cobalt-precorrin-5B (C(1))-methyltransferase, partial [Atopobiaceae bacterium]|nr:cobalt-precorrin-5B (C(1))-methyltransferase [Atopobiaceae bacterium]